MAAGAGDEHLIAFAAKSLGDGRIGACPVENDVGCDTAGQSSLFVQVAHTAQVALAFFAHVAEKQRDAGNSTPDSTRAWAMASMPATPAPLSQAPGASRRSAFTTGSGEFRRERRCPGARRERRWGRCIPGGGWGREEGQRTFPISSEYTPLRPASVKRETIQAERACSPKGGAGMATSSTCQSMMRLGLPCSQEKAAWTGRCPASAVTRANGELGKCGCIPMASG